MSTTRGPAPVAQGVNRESVACRKMSDSWRARDVQAGVAHCRPALPEVVVSSVFLHGLQHLKQYRWRPMFNDGASNTFSACPLTFQQA